VPDEGWRKQGWGINFESFVLFETPHAHVKGAFRKPDLGHAVIQIQE